MEELFKITMALFLMFSFSSGVYGVVADVEGYTKFFAESHTNSSRDDFSSDFKLYTSANRLSLILSEGSFATELSGRLFLFYLKGDQSNISLDVSKKSPYRVDDLKFIFHKERNELYLAKDLDRAFFSYNSEFVTLDIGRQPLSFGSARFVNPTDIFAPLSIQTIDREERAGVDLIRVRKYFDNYKIDAGYLFGEKNQDDNNALYIRAETTVKNIDIAIMGAGYQKRKLYGLDVKSEIFGAGIWLEATHTRGVNDSFNRVSLGGEYFFSSDIALLAEYNYDSLGAVKTSEYLMVSKNEELQAAQIHQLGREYFNVALSKQVSALVSGSLSITRNLHDASNFLNSTLSWNATENSYIDTGIFYKVAKKNTEFEFYQNSVFAAYKYYF